MRTDLSAPALAALASEAVSLVQFVRIAFPGGTVALNTSNWTFLWGGDNYVGANGLGTIAPIVDATGGEVFGVTLEMDAGSPDVVSLALDEADQVQGAPVAIRTAIVDSATGAVLDAPVEWAGACDTMGLSEDGESAVVTVSAESRAVDLMKGNPSTLSDGDQQDLYAGDLAFQYVVDQLDKPIVWPAKEYYYK